MKFLTKRKMPADSERAELEEEGRRRKLEAIEKFGDFKFLVYANGDNNKAAAQVNFHLISLGLCILIISYFCRFSNAFEVICWLAANTSRLSFGALKLTTNLL